MLFSIHFLVNIILIIIQIWINQFVDGLYKSKKCNKCSFKKGWQINQVRILSALLILATLLNIIFPIFKLLNAIPLISSIAIFIYLGILIYEFIMMKRIGNEFKSKNNECYKCRQMMTNMDIWLSDYWADQNIGSCIGYAFIITIIQFYF